MMISLLLGFIGLQEDELKSILEKLTISYSADQLHMSYELEVRHNNKVVQSSQGVLMKNGKSYFKQMDQVSHVSNGDYALTIDERLMTVYYHLPESTDEKSSEIVPDFDMSGINIITKGASELVFRSNAPNEIVDSTDYYVDPGKGILNKVVHYKTLEEQLYISEINYTTSGLHNSVDMSKFDMSQYLNGKGKKAQLNSTYINQGFSFVNTLLNEIE